MKLFVPGCASLDGSVYVVGGYDSTSQLRTVERYSVVTDRWEFVAPMKSPRSALSVAVLGGKLYALGKHHFLAVVSYLSGSFKAVVCLKSSRQTDWYILHCICIAVLCLYAVFKHSMQQKRTVTSQWKNDLNLSHLSKNQ